MSSRLPQSFLFALLTVLSAVGQNTKALPHGPIKVSVCELAEHPEQYDNKEVTIQGRFSVNWEWGGWIHDGTCKDVLRFGLPSSHWVPSQYARLKVEHDDGFREFDKSSRLLCNGMEAFCDFDYLEAEFTGTFIAAEHLKEDPLSGKEPPSSAVVITRVKNAKLHTGHDGRLQTAPIPVPDAIRNPNGNR